MKQYKKIYNGDGSLRYIEETMPNGGKKNIPLSSSNKDYKYFLEVESDNNKSTVVDNPPTKSEKDLIKVNSKKAEMLSIRREEIIQALCDADSKYKSIKNASSLSELESLE